MALELTGAGSREQQRLRVSLGDALANAGRGRDAAEQYLAAVGARTDVPALELKRRAAEQLLRAGHLERGMEVFEEVIAATGMRMPGTSKLALVGLPRPSRSPAFARTSFSRAQRVGHPARKSSCAWTSVGQRVWALRQWIIC